MDESKIIQLTDDKFNVSKSVSTNNLKIYEKNKDLLLTVFIQRKTLGVNRLFYFQTLFINSLFFPLPALLFKVR